MAEENGDLAGVGVDAFDESVYRAVLVRGVVTPADLASVLDERPGRVVAALDRLRALGLVSRLAGRRRRYAANEPRAALELLMRQRMSELDGVRDIVETLHRAFAVARAENRSGDPVETIIGREALGGWFARMQQEASEEMLVLDRPPYALAAENPVEPVTLGRGVRVRAVYAPAALELPGALDEIDRLTAHGEQARVLPGLPIKLAIQDRRLALMPLTLDMSTVRAVLVRRSTLLDALIEAFESYWRQALPLRIVTGEPADAVDADDRILLRMLVSGLKDEAIARQLGCSLRTMRRRIRRLLDILGAENRFQAGVQASRRGWI
ncbi:TrmB family transcriptional regulator [Plantactinospora sp. GCM10030261]|uniref:TrmB family transcriptional regulator n=1 Tax=Plantactinospora sp. GCM10030261 TaxID=3273420 RepID=UPI00360E7D7D